MTFSLSHFPTLGVTFSLSLDRGKAREKSTKKPDPGHEEVRFLCAGKGRRCYSRGIRISVIFSSGGVVPGSVR